MAQADPERRRTAVAIGLAVVASAAALYLGALVLRRVWPAIQLLVLAYLVATAITPAVDWLTKRRVPRPIAVLGIVAAVAAVIIIAAVLIVPPVIAQAVEFARSLPNEWERLQSLLADLSRDYPWLQERVSKIDLAGEAAARTGAIATYLTTVLGGAVGALMAAIFLGVTVILMLLNPTPLVHGLLNAFPERFRPKAESVGAKLVDRVRDWIRGLIILMAAVGILAGVGLSLVGIPYAILFGALAGVLEVVPTLGPILAAVPPLLVALAQEPIKGLYVVIIFVVVNQLENNLLVPFVMSKRLNLHPVSVVAGFLIMTGLFGLFGAVVAMPTVACIKVLYDELYAPWAHPSRGQPGAPVEAGSAE